MSVVPESGCGKEASSVRRSEEEVRGRRSSEIGDDVTKAMTSLEMMK